MQYWFEPQYHLIENKEQLISLCKILKESSDNGQPICLDTETTSVFPDGKGAVDNFHGWLLGISFCVSKNESYYIPLDHVENGIKRPNQLSIEEIRDHLNPILSVKNVFILHNSKFDYKALYRSGIELYPSFWDTMSAVKIINGDSFKSAALKKVIKNYIDIPTTVSFEEASGGDAAEVDPAEFIVYACNDTIFTFYLYEALKPIIDKHYHKLFYEIEAPFTPLLAHMELKGIRIDPEYFHKIKIPLEKGKLKIEKYFLDKYNISISSNDQLRTIIEPLCENIELPRTDKGAISTGEEALEMIMRKSEKGTEEYFIAKHTLKHRGINKALNTYVNKIPNIGHQHYNGSRIDILHTVFNQIINSGRLSSSPNIQNLPRDNMLISVRKGFVPRDGYVFIDADWSSAEYHLVSIASEDTKLIKAYTENSRADFHLLTAQSLFEKKEITKEERHKGKTFNFARVYGASKYGIARALNCSLDDAQNYINKNDAFFDGVTSWKKKIKNEITKNRFTETFWGRRRYLSDRIFPQMDKQYQYEAAVRELTNHIIQGTNADLLKWCMVKISKEYAAKNLDAHILTCVHDSIVVEARKEIVMEASEIVKRIMEVTIKGIELPVDLDIKSSFAKE